MSPLLQSPSPVGVGLCPSLCLHSLKSPSFLQPSSAPKPLLSKSLRVASSSSSAPNSLPPSDQQILQSISNLDDANPRGSLPAVRTYENDLTRLTFIGDVAFQQALTAAAADGGTAADEHILANMPTMVVETVFPGPLDDRSTVSTRLFLPTRKVKEKARKLRSTLSADMLSSTTSKNILAMTFRQVVLQQIWSFELQLFSPGAERNMEALESQREVPTTFTLSSSDERVLSVLAEAVCVYALESTEADFRESKFVSASQGLFGWFQKPKRFSSKDFSVIIYKMSQDVLVENAKMLFQTLDTKEISCPRKMKKKYSWWMSSTNSKLESFGGPEFINWTSEYVPAYRLQIDANKLKNVKLEGWKKSAENRWEVLLTHSQMMELADILDMYYEDVYTLPNKHLSCMVAADFKNLSNVKSGTSLWKTLGTALVGGLFVVSISILAQVYLPHFFRTRKSPADNFLMSSPEVELYKNQHLDSSELEGSCIAIVKKVKDAVGWPGDIETDAVLGAWTGELPSYLRKMPDVNVHKDVLSINQESNDTSVGVPSPPNMPSTPALPSDEVNTDMKASAQDIASYQVVLSKEGNVVGFQPTSRLAVNHWARNPLVKDLYNGRKLSPGFIEPGLKAPRPDGIILLELLMSVNPESWFALVRPFRDTR